MYRYSNEFPQDKLPISTAIKQGGTQAWKMRNVPPNPDIQNKFNGFSFQILFLFPSTIYSRYFFQTFNVIWNPDFIMFLPSLI